MNDRACKVPDILLLEISQKLDKIIKEKKSITKDIEELIQKFSKAEIISPSERPVKKPQVYMDHFLGRSRTITEAPRPNTRFLYNMIPFR